MSTLEDFKKTKRELKGKIASIDGLLSQVDDTHDFNKLNQLVQQTREQNIQSKKLLEKMSAQWNLLNPSDRGQYNEKLSRFRKEQQDINNRFKKCEERFNTENNQKKLNLKKRDGTQEKFDEDLREQLIHGTGELNDMDNKLKDIEATGHQTAQIMQDANKDLLSQRQIIQRVDDKNANIRNNLKDGKKVISQISYNEYKQRAILYFAIFILFITDIVLLFVVISRAIRG